MVQIETENLTNEKDPDIDSMNKKNTYTGYKVVLLSA